MRTLLLSVGMSAVLVAPLAHAADLDIIEAPMAGDFSGAYVAARIAGAFSPDTNFNLTVVPTNIVNDYDRLGFGGALAVGYEFGWGSNVSLRGELEGGLISTEIDSHTLVAIATTLDGPAAFGTTEIVYGMVNAAVDYDFGNGFKPFLSGGIGLAEVNFKNHGVALAAPVGPLGPGNVTAMNDRDSGLAWQIGAGIGYEVDEKVTLEAGYRYFQVNDISLAAVDGTVTNVPIKQHQVMLGVRYGF
ncbi:MAG: outer membrane beta-barrel protein [Phyllobacteriaceae bacterium]|jgi:opacity protein-like surface antigen|nr:outer membrane beta-barrel protein [Phyllobacteriaceae bacterium]